MLQKYSRWQPYGYYINRIEGFRDDDFSLCIESAKSLLEGIAKEICKLKGRQPAQTESMGKVLGHSFLSLGYSHSDTIKQIAGAIANIGQQMGNFRNEIGAMSHGKTVEELSMRQNSISELSCNFLIESTEIVCCFLIETFENENPLKAEEAEITYQDNQEFNDFWDEQFGEFTMSDYSFSASETLFNNDPKAYRTELDAFKLNQK
ncbi:MAG TPA: abortive infection family protein [Chitinophagaceae bacterium]|nr:abortive infection family protein [Chitinophagaceae bacterium]